MHICKTCQDTDYWDQNVFTDFNNWYNTVQKELQSTTKMGKLVKCFWFVNYKNMTQADIYLTHETKKKL